MRWLGLSIMFAVAACGSSENGAVSDTGSPETGGGPAADAGKATGGSVGSGGSKATGGASAAGGSKATGGSAGSGGSSAAGGSSATGGSTGSGGARPPAPDGGPAGVWTDVTPSSITVGPFGEGYLCADPDRPSDVYIGAGSGNNGLLRSTDYGLTWTQVSSTTGHFTIALASQGASKPPAFFTPDGSGSGKIYKSTDGGATWRVTGNGNLTRDLYSITVDPYDPTHLLSGLHEGPGIAESLDSGETWTMIGAFPNGSGFSWYPFFVDTGAAATTHETWIAIPQDTGGGNGTQRTTDQGATWTKVDSNEHPHGNSQIYEDATAVYMAGQSGVLRSTDLGATWAHVGGNHYEGVVWGTPSHIYTMYGWACSMCNVGPNYQVAPQPGTTGWTDTQTPAGMTLGAGSVAVLFDGTHHIFVGSMWSAGIWRYVEP